MEEAALPPTQQPIAKKKWTGPFSIRYLHLFILFHFAVTFPIFQILADDRGFFITYRFTPGELIGLTILLALAGPVALCAIEWLVGFISRSAQQVVHNLLIAGLTTVFLLPIFIEYQSLSGPVQVALALTLGITVAILQFKVQAINLFISALTPCLLVFPTIFLLSGPCLETLFPEQSSPDTVEYPSQPLSSKPLPPIVFIVFDEFPITSLLDASGNIDSRLYPNFAAFSQQAAWFPNTYSASDHTYYAVPAILTGLKPDYDKSPTLQYYPHNLFTLFGNSHHLVVQESITKLCPTAACNEEKPMPTRQKFVNILTELRRAFERRIYPDDLEYYLMDIKRQWKEKHRKAVPDRGRTALFNRFLAKILPPSPNKPSLYYLHMHLPHRPWTYLPSGRSYQTLSDMEYANFNTAIFSQTDKAYLAKISLHQHLLQVAYCDTVLGELFDKLKAANLYDEALIVVTADHGVSPLAKESRNVDESNIQDVLPVPLLIKSPGQRHGQVIKTNITTVDILPAIADVLKIDLPWQIDGQSPYKPDYPHRTHHVAYPLRFSKTDKRTVRYPFDAKALQQSLARNASIFSVHNNKSLVMTTPYDALLGRPVTQLPVKPATDIRIRVRNQHLIEHVDVKSDFVPADIVGDVVSLQRLNHEPLTLAIALNGTIRGITQTLDHRDKAAVFELILPEQAFQEKNRIEVFVLGKDKAGQPYLTATQAL